MSIKLIKEKEEIFPINIKLKSVIVKRDYSLNGTLEVFSQIITFLLYTERMDVARQQY